MAPTTSTLGMLTRKALAGERLRLEGALLLRAPNADTSNDAVYRWVSLRGKGTINGSQRQR